MNGVKGKEKITTVFALYLVIPGILLAALSYFIPVTPNTIIALSLQILCWGLVNIISMWRCAFNTNKKILGYISRVGSPVLALALVPVLANLVVTLQALSMYGQPN